MLSERIEKLKQQYTGQYVAVDEKRAELARFAGQRGRVKTVNLNGCALVQFEGPDRSWYDIQLDYLKVVDKPDPDPAPDSPQSDPADKAAPQKPEPPGGNSPPQKLSRLELARLEKEAEQAGETNPQ